jgi:hypothetical protein
MTNKLRREHGSARKQERNPASRLVAQSLANATWFVRLADCIPFCPLLEIDRSTVPHANVTPTRHTSSIDSHEFLTLAYNDHTGNQSPANAHCWELQRLKAPDALLHRCCEALELPGTPRDYHHLLGMTYAAVHPFGQAHNEAVATLCHADIALIEQYPNIIQLGTIYARVDAYRILNEIYERQGRHDLAEHIRARASKAHQRT